MGAEPEHLSETARVAAEQLLEVVDDGAGDEDAASRLDANKLVLGGASAAALGLLVWRISRRRT